MEKESENLNNSTDNDNQEVNQGVEYGNDSYISDTELLSSVNQETESGVTYNSELSKEEMDSLVSEIKERRNKASKATKLNKKSKEYIRPSGKGLIIALFNFFTTTAISSISIVSLYTLIVSWNVLNPDRAQGYLIVWIIVVFFVFVIFIGSLWQMLLLLNYMTKGKNKKLAEALAVPYGIMVGSILLINYEEPPTALMLYSQKLNPHENYNYYKKSQIPFKKPKRTEILGVIIIILGSLFFLVLGIIVSLSVMDNNFILEIIEKGKIFNYSEGRLFLIQFSFLFFLIPFIFVSFLSLYYSFVFIKNGNRRFILTNFGYFFGIVIGGYLIKMNDVDFNDIDYDEKNTSANNEKLSSENNSSDMGDQLQNKNSNSSIE